MPKTLIAALLVALSGATTASAAGTFNFVSAPSLHPLKVSIARRASGLAPGFIFVAPIGTPPPLPAKGAKRPKTLRKVKLTGEYGPLIIDDHGNPVWEHPLGHGLQALNFRPQTLNGASVLTWWQGQLSAQGVGTGENVIVDSSYRPVATVRAGNRLGADLHDFVITPEGTALLTAYKPVRMDLRPYRGPRSGVVYDSVVQEVDIKTGRVLFEWHPLKSVSLRDSYTVPVKGMKWDPYHVNAVQLQPNGDLLISARNTWTAYSVSRKTGKIVWRLGGKHSSFKLGGASRFAWQHDVTLQPDGTTITLFDNEAAPPVRKLSRSLVLSLDMTRRIARIAHAYTHAGVLAGSQGSTQILPNGNVFVGWGAAPYISEFSQSGQLLFDARYPKPDESYRAFRLPWAGHPASPPAVAVRRASGAKTTVYASWNGATEVATWQVLAGPNAGSLSVVASSPRMGFETAISVSADQPYFAARALNAAGQTLGTSPAVKR
ncbi:MAG: hypothetical protein NVSMB25_06740 [Thermoleophilaceae bacterium]